MNARPCPKDHFEDSSSIGRVFQFGWPPDTKSEEVRLEQELTRMVDRWIHEFLLEGTYQF
jgi:hypothetical protein